MADEAKLTVSPNVTHDATADMTIPVVEEHVRVQKRVVPTSVVRVIKTVHERTVPAEPLYAEAVEVERVPIQRIVDEPPAPREEDDVIVFSTVTEVYVKRYRVDEEIRVRRVRRIAEQPEPHRVRYEEVDVERRAIDELPEHARPTGPDCQQQERNAGHEE